MEFVSAFLTSLLQMVVLAGVIVCAVWCGHKLRDRKDAKDVK